MAKGELVIGGDTTAATQSFVNAVTYMGGSVTSMTPSRPVEFKVSRSGNLGGYGAPYGGTATFVQVGADQTRVLIEIRPKAVYTAILIAASLGVITLAGALTQDEDTIMTVTAILLPVLAVVLYLYYVPWGNQVIDKLQAGVHGTVPAYQTPHSAPASPGPASPGPASPAPAPAAPAAPAPAPDRSSPIAEQMQQLATLKEQGLISEEEFAAKKAELLKRL